MNEWQCKSHRCQQQKNYFSAKLQNSHWGSHIVKNHRWFYNRDIQKNSTVVCIDTCHDSPQNFFLSKKLLRIFILVTKVYKNWHFQTALKIWVYLLYSTLRFYFLFIALNRLQYTRALPREHLTVKFASTDDSSVFNFERYDMHLWYTITYIIYYILLYTLEQ